MIDSKLGNIRIVSNGYSTTYSPHPSKTRHGTSVLIPCFVGLATDAGGHDRVDSVRIVSHRHRASSRRCLDLPPLPNNYPDFFRYLTHVPNTILITADYLFPATAGSQKVKVSGEVTYTLGESLPEPSLWLETLAGPGLSWLRTLLTSVTIAQGTSYIDNPIQRLLAPRPYQKVVVSPTSVIVHGAVLSFGSHKDGFKVVVILYKPSSGHIFEECRSVSLPPLLHFEYKPSMGSAPIHKIPDGCNERIKRFY
jgi:Fatty acid synthase meander beta sheet domain